VELGNVRVGGRSQSAEDRSKIVAGCRSRAGLNLTVDGCSGIFHEAGVRVWPVRLVGVESARAVYLECILPRGPDRGTARVQVDVG
jgi:hypothetical protein